MTVYEGVQDSSDVCYMTSGAFEFLGSVQVEPEAADCAVATLRLSPSASLGASAKQGRLSQKAREVAHPS